MRSFKFSFLSTTVIPAFVGAYFWTDKVIPEVYPRQTFAPHHHNPVITFDSRLQGRSDRISAF